MSAGAFSFCGLASLARRPRLFRVFLVFALDANPAKRIPDGDLFDCSRHHRRQGPPPRSPRLDRRQADPQRPEGRRRPLRAHQRFRLLLPQQGQLPFYLGSIQSLAPPPSAAETTPARDEAAARARLPAGELGANRPLRRHRTETLAYQRSLGMMYTGLWVETGYYGGRGGLRVVGGRQRRGVSGHLTSGPPAAVTRSLALLLPPGGTGEGLSGY